MPGAVGVDDVDLEFAVGTLEAIKDEDDPGPVRRPVPVEVGHGLPWQQRLEVAAVGAGGPQAHLAGVQARKKEALAVGRPGEVLEEIALVRDATTISHR